MKNGFATVDLFAPEGRPYNILVQYPGHNVTLLVPISDDTLLELAERFVDIIRRDFSEEILDDIEPN